MKIYSFLTVSTFFFGSAALALSQSVVSPNDFLISQGPVGSAGPFHGSQGISSGDLTFQWLLPKSDFADVPVGSELTSIGFRPQHFNLTPPTNTVSIAKWNLQLSSSPRTISTLSTTFASNIGLDVVTVRSGPLEIQAGSLPITTFPGPNAFFDIPFTTFYKYTGGDLLVTLRHTSHEFSQGEITVDADRVSNGRGNSVGRSGFNAVQGSVGYYNFPATKFTYVVPEPSGLVLIVYLTLSALVFPIQGRRRHALTVHTT
ncbi:hypothetical protein [Bythopirellula polymerisocia]|uniref:PEP-CTERM protein-sorting domain-containing protein n=1 Tax=Bythopirellula polymerisocia TaxID=2528003 RepID=A0A5C6D2H1_9BACT|nr:hypothetical protein [Bythopirellula polymerisocia]TWU29981.1 hypothetical protein Pla144_07620 [Bythopirellula polymerisocia]